MAQPKKIEGEFSFLCRDCAALGAEIESVNVKNGCGGNHLLRALVAARRTRPGCGHGR